MQPHGQAPQQLLPLPGRQPEDIYNVPSCQLHNLRACTVHDSGRERVRRTVVFCDSCVGCIFHILIHVFTLCIFGSYSFLSAVLQFHGSQFNGLVPFW